MEQYFHTLIDRRNTLPLFLGVNLCAVVGGVIAHYGNAPVWTSFVGCLAIILLSPLWINRKLSNKAHEDAEIARLSELVRSYREREEKNDSPKSAGHDETEVQVLRRFREMDTHVQVLRRLHEMEMGRRSLPMRMLLKISSGFIWVRLFSRRLRKHKQNTSGRTRRAGYSQS